MKNNITSAASLLTQGVWSTARLVLLLNKSALCIGGVIRGSMAATFLVAAFSIPIIANASIVTFQINGYVSSVWGPLSESIRPMDLDTNGYYVTGGYAGDEVQISWQVDISTPANTSTSLTDCSKGRFEGTCTYINAIRDVSIQFGTYAASMAQLPSENVISASQAGLYSASSIVASLDGDLINGVSPTSINMTSLLYIYPYLQDPFLAIDTMNPCMWNPWSDRNTTICISGYKEFDYHFDDRTIDVNFTEGGFQMAAYGLPIPPALYLFTSGLLGLIGVARRKAIKVVHSN